MHQRTRIRISGQQFEQSEGAALERHNAAAHYQHIELKQILNTCTLVRCDEVCFFKIK